MGEGGGSRRRIGMENNIVLKIKKKSYSPASGKVSAVQQLCTSGGGLPQESSYSSAQAL